jgi:uncharacterized protein with von Willebrand factor type A (vWA) domain
MESDTSVSALNFGPYDFDTFSSCTTREGSARRSDLDLPQEQERSRRNVQPMKKAAFRRSMKRNLSRGGFLIMAYMTVRSKGAAASDHVYLRAKRAQEWRVSWEEPGANQRECRN